MEDDIEAAQDHHVEVLVMDAFLTGSRAYGAPSPESDFDLVVRISNEDFWKLATIHEPHEQRLFEGEGSFKTPCVKVGRLSLICCTSDEEYDRWLKFTRKAIEKAPVSRQKAIRARERFFEK